MAPPGRRLEGIREILGLVHDLSVPELHNTHRVGWSPLVGNGVFRDPEITVSENSPDIEACRLTGMVTSQGLQITSPEDSFARLGIITNGIVVVNIVFRIGIAGCRGVPMSSQRFTYLFFWPGLRRDPARFVAKGQLRVAKLSVSIIILVFRRFQLLVSPRLGNQAMGCVSAPV